MARTFLIADRHLEFAVEDVEDFRFMTMHVQRRTMPGRDRLLQNRISAAGLLRQHLEQAAVAQHADRLSLARAANDGDVVSVSGGNRGAASLVLLGVLHPEYPRFTMTKLLDDC